MKNISLALFVTLMLLGWTALVGGVIAVLAADPAASWHKHDHVIPNHGVEPPATPLLSDAPCPLGERPDAAGLCPA